MTEQTAAALASQLIYARTHVPYYQRSIPDGEITADNTFTVLRGLPLLHREEVRVNRVRLWSASGDTRTWRTVRTTGTTGTPIEVIVDFAAQQAELATLARHIDKFVSTNKRSKRTVFHLTLHAAARTRTSPSPWSPRARLVKWNLSRPWQLPDERFLECLREIDGHVVTAMPSVMSALLDRMGNRRSIHPLLVVLSGETVDDNVQDRISTVFGCPTTSLYTLAEMGIAATGCTTSSGYHVNDSDVVIELLDHGREARVGTTGDVIITSLANKAMPLLRYLTGDRASWDAQPCGCPIPGRLFQLHAARVRAVAGGPTGRHITCLDVAKLFSQLDVQAINLVQDGPDIVVKYRAEANLEGTSSSMIAAAIRGMLGPGTTVRLHRLTAEHTNSNPPRPKSAPIPPAPTGTQPAELATWARNWLADEHKIIAAVLTGSVLSTETFTRFSDIDLSVLINDRPDDLRWRTVAKVMHQHLAGLRVNVTTAAELSDAPLITARLLAEHFPIVGSLERCGIVWPTVEHLAREARFWVQDARAVLRTHVTATDGSAEDPLRGAWLAAKYAMNALRYHFLCRGARSTRPSDIIRMALAENVPNFPGIQTALNVATERRPPPPPGSSEPEHYLVNALSALEWTYQHLPS